MGTVTRRRPRALPALLLLAWLSSTGAFGNCNFFKPAQPERPKGTAIIADYSSATRTLDTIARGITDKNGSNGQEVYLRAFADSLPNGTDGRAYHGFFDVADMDRVPSWDRNSDWTRTLEQSFYVSFIQFRSVPYEMTWERYEPAGNDQGTDVDSLLHRQYKVYQVISGNRSLIAIGVTDLYFIKAPTSPTRWVIARWQDFVSPDANRSQHPDEETFGYRRISPRP